MIRRTQSAVTLRRALLALLLTGCSDAASGPVTIDTLPGGIVRVTNRSPADSGKWSLVLERTVQPPDDSAGALRDPSDLLLFDDGSMVVSDRKPEELMHFDPEGRYLRSIGQSGEGRGEYRSAWLAAHGDTLVVHDPKLGRTTARLLSTGDVVSERVEMPMMFLPLGVDGSGRAVIPMVPPRDTGGPSHRSVVRYPMNGTGVDTVTVPTRAGPKQSWAVRSGGEVVLATPVPLQAYDLVAADPVGGLLIGWGGEYVIRATRDGRDTTMIFSRPRGPGSEVTAAEKESHILRQIASSRKYLPTLPEQNFRDGFAASQIPDQRPAFDLLAADRTGRRWVLVPTPDTTVVQFDLFDRNGRWLDIVRVPQSGWSDKTWRPASWATDRVAVIVMDEEGRPVIKVYRIVQG